jgi:hypothetical protein
MRYLPLLLLSLSACAPMATAERPLVLPASLEGKATVLEPADPAYAQGNVAAAIKAAGQGGVSAALVIRLSQDMPVYRMWNGPQAANNNRLGSWWAFDAPAGTREGYRRAYEICGGWNELQWVAACTLKQGTVVVIGPGQSVSPEVCADASGYERYEANGRAWQVYVNQAWNRTEALACPPADKDYRADPANVAQPLK